MEDMTVAGVMPLPRYGADRRFGAVAIEIDGPYEVRNAIREHTKHRLNWIKIMADELQQDELEAAIKTAPVNLEKDEGQTTSGSSTLNNRSRHSIFSGSWLFLQRGLYDASAGFPGLLTKAI